MTRALLVAALLVAACGAEDGTGPIARECSVPGATAPASVGSIGCERDYELMGYEDDPFATFAHTRSVNVIIDRANGDRPYFIDTQTYWLHFDFVYFVLTGHPSVPPSDPSYNQAHQQFNATAYHGADRRWIIGKVVQFLDSGELVYELAAGDDAGADMIVEGFEVVRAKVFDGARMKYRPVANGQEQLLPELETRIPTITTAELFAGQTYQPLNRATGYGTLRFRHTSELAATPLVPTDIVVLDRVPNDISICSGIITQEFQTPLSHINVLSKQRAIPNMAVRDAFTDDELRALDGQVVKLTVMDADWTVEAANAAEAQAWWDARRPSEPLIPQKDLSVTGFVDLATVGSSAVSYIGAKAANFAELYRIVPAVRVPPNGMGIPFSAFDKHMTDNGIWADVDALIADAPTGTALEERLFALRWKIFSSPIDAAFVAALETEIRDRFGTEEARFRSSTNVEDLAVFSGAGLYTSVGVTADDGPEAIARAVKTVWASAYNTAAYLERDFYRVAHREVRMGVLVSRSFGREVANGVALTANEFTTLRPAFYINSQLGDVSVTNPTGEATPEQILWYRYYDGSPEYYEVLTRSSLTDGEPVLADEQYQELAGMLERVHQRFRVLFCGIPGTDPVRYDPACATDVEWKVATDGMIYIKQARPLRSGASSN